MSPEDFKRLVAANMDTDQIALVMELMARDAKVYAEADEARKAKGRDRVAKWRLEHPRNVTETSPNVTVRLAGVEDRTSNLEIPSKEESKKQDAPSRDVDDFRAGLSPDVPPDLISEFIKVRRKKRGAITGYAAKLFHEDAAKVGMSVADAAKECVRSSWITVKPEYFAGRARAGPAPRSNPTLDAAKALMEKLDAVSPTETQANPAYPRLVAFSGGG